MEGYRPIGGEGRKGHAASSGAANAASAGARDRARDLVSNRLVSAEVKESSLERALRVFKTGVLGVLYVMNKRQESQNTVWLVLTLLNVLQALSFPLRESLWENSSLIVSISSLVDSLSLRVFSLSIFKASMRLAGYFTATAWILFVLATAIVSGVSFARGRAIISALKLLRLTARLTLTALFIPLINLQLSIFVCGDTGSTSSSSTSSSSSSSSSSSTTTGLTNTWGDTGWTCWRGPHLGWAIVTVIIGIFFVLLALVVVSVFFPRDPNSNSLATRIHGRTALIRLAVDLLNSLVFGLVKVDSGGTAWPLRVFLVIAYGTVTFVNTYYMSYHFLFSNKLEIAANCALLWASFAALIKPLFDDPAVPGYILWFGMPLAVFTGWNIAIARYEFFERVPAADLRSPLLLEVKARIVHQRLVALVAAARGQAQALVAGSDGFGGDGGGGGGLGAPGAGAPGSWSIKSGLSSVAGLFVGGAGAAPGASAAVSAAAVPVAFAGGSASSLRATLSGSNTTAASFAIVARAGMLPESMRGGAGMAPSAGPLAPSAHGADFLAAGTGSSWLRGIGASRPGQLDGSANNYRQVFEECEFMYRRAIEANPTSASLHLLYASYLDYNGKGTHRQRELIHLAAGEAKGPALDFWVIAWQRRRAMEESDQDIERISETGGADAVALAGGSHMSVLARITYEKHLGDALRNAIKARSAMVAFWGELRRLIPDLDTLHKLGGEASTIIERTETAFTAALRLNSRDLFVLRKYAAFNADVLNQEGRARQLLEEAESLEDSSAKASKHRVTHLLLLAPSNGGRLDLSSPMSAWLSLTFGPRSEVPVIADASNAVQTLTGYSVADVLHQPLPAVFARPTSALVLALLRQWAAGDAVPPSQAPAFVLLQHKGGHAVPALMQLHLPAETGPIAALHPVVASGTEGVITFVVVPRPRSRVRPARARGGGGGVAEEANASDWLAEELGYGSGEDEGDGGAGTAPEDEADEAGDDGFNGAPPFCCFLTGADTHSLDVLELSGAALARASASLLAAPAATIAAWHELQERDVEAGTSGAAFGSGGAVPGAPVLGASFTGAATTGAARRSSSLAASNGFLQATSTPLSRAAASLVDLCALIPSLPSLIMDTAGDMQSAGLDGGGSGGSARLGAGASNPLSSVLLGGGGGAAGTRVGLGSPSDGHPGTSAGPWGALYASRETSMSEVYSATGRRRLLAEVRAQCVRSSVPWRSGDDLDDAAVLRVLTSGGVGGGRSRAGGARVAGGGGGGSSGGPTVYDFVTSPHTTFTIHWKKVKQQVLQTLPPVASSVPLAAPPAVLPVPPLGPPGELAGTVAAAAGGDFLSSPVASAAGAGRAPGLSIRTPSSRKGFDDVGGAGGSTPMPPSSAAPGSPPGTWAAPTPGDTFRAASRRVSMERRIVKAMTPGGPSGGANVSGAAAGPRQPGTSRVSFGAEETVGTTRATPRAPHSSRGGNGHTSTGRRGSGSSTELAQFTDADAAEGVVVVHPRGSARGDGTGAPGTSRAGSVLSGTKQSAADRGSVMSGDSSQKSGSVRSATLHALRRLLTARTNSEDGSLRQLRRAFMLVFAATALFLALSHMLHVLFISSLHTATALVHVAGRIEVHLESVHADVGTLVLMDGGYIPTWPAHVALNASTFGTSRRLKTTFDASVDTGLPAPEMDAEWLEDAGVALSSRSDVLLHLSRLGTTLETLVRRVYTDSAAILERPDYDGVFHAEERIHLVRLRAAGALGMPTVVPYRATPIDAMLEYLSMVAAAVATPVLRPSSPPVAWLLANHAPVRAAVKDVTVMLETAGADAHDSMAVLSTVIIIVVALAFDIILLGVIAPVLKTVEQSKDRVLRSFLYIPLPAVEKLHVSTQLQLARESRELREPGEDDSDNEIDDVTGLDMDGLLGEGEESGRRTVTGAGSAHGGDGASTAGGHHHRSNTNASGHAHFDGGASSRRSGRSGGRTHSHGASEVTDGSARYDSRSGAASGFVPGPVHPPRRVMLPAAAPGEDGEDDEEAMDSDAASAGGEDVGGRGAAFDDALLEAAGWKSSVPPLPAVAGAAPREPGEGGSSATEPDAAAHVVVVTEGSVDGVAAAPAPAAAGSAGEGGSSNGASGAAATLPAPDTTPAASAPAPAPAAATPAAASRSTRASRGGAPAPASAANPAATPRHPSRNAIYPADAALLPPEQGAAAPAGSSRKERRGGRSGKGSDALLAPLKGKAAQRYTILQRMAGVDTAADGLRRHSKSTKAFFMLMVRFAGPVVVILAYLASMYGFQLVTGDSLRWAPLTALNTHQRHAALIAATTATRFTLVGGSACQLVAQDLAAVAASGSAGGSGATGWTAPGTTPAAVASLAASLCEPSLRLGGALFPVTPGGVAEASSHYGMVVPVTPLVAASSAQLMTTLMTDLASMLSDANAAAASSASTTDATAGVFLHAPADIAAPSLLAYGPQGAFAEYPYNETSGTGRALWTLQGLHALTSSLLYGTGTSFLSTGEGAYRFVVGEVSRIAMGSTHVGPLETRNGHSYAVPGESFLTSEEAARITALQNLFLRDGCATAAADTTAAAFGASTTGSGLSSPPPLPLSLQLQDVAAYTARCRAFANGALTNGLLPAFKDVVSRLASWSQRLPAPAPYVFHGADAAAVGWCLNATAAASTAGGAGLNATSHQGLACASLNDGGFGLTRSLALVYVSRGFRQASLEHLGFLTRTTDSFTAAHLALTLSAAAGLAMFYLLAYRTAIARVNRDLGRTLKMLLMLPNTLMKLPQIQEMIADVTQSLQSSGSLNAAAGTPSPGVVSGSSSHNLVGGGGPSSPFS